jgi:hypothetical protein
MPTKNDKVRKGIGENIGSLDSNNEADRYSAIAISSGGEHNLKEPPSGEIRSKNTANSVRKQ